MSHRTDLEDILGEASSFAHALHLAANGIDDGKNSCALMVLAEHIQGCLSRARDIVDELGRE
jgi:3-oxoacyl-[acyl-carrier-protein] synthase III